MFGCRWLQVFALASCVARSANAGLEVLSQSATVRLNEGPKLVRISTEFQLSPEGHLVTLCFLSRIPAVPQQVQMPAERILPDGSLESSPSDRCSLPKTPTPVYDSESLFGTLNGAKTNVSLIQEEAKKYVVSYDRLKSFSKAEVLGIILNAMLAVLEHEELMAGINALKSQIKSGGLGEEKPKTVVVCLPAGGFEEKIVNNCTSSESVFDVASKDTTASKPYGKAPVRALTTSLDELPKSAKEDDVEGDQQRIKTLNDCLDGSTATPGDRGPQKVETYLPNTAEVQTFGPLSAFVRSSLPSATLSPEAASVIIPKTSPMDIPTKTTRSASLPAAQYRQTAKSLQFSFSGIIKAAWPLSISKVSAQLSLSFEPAEKAPGPPSDTTDYSTDFGNNPKLSPPAPTESSASTNSFSSKTPTMTVNNILNPEPHLPQSVTTLVTGDRNSAMASTSTPVNFTSGPFPSSSEAPPGEMAATSTKPPTHFSVPFNSISSQSPLSPESAVSTSNSPTATSSAPEFSLKSTTVVVD